MEEKKEVKVLCEVRFWLFSFTLGGDAASCHCVALDTEGRCYTWGRNEKGQLGHGDKISRDRPTVVSELSKHKIVRAAAGRSHTVVVTDDGQSFAFGWNKHGQLGSAKNEIEPSPVRCAVTEVKTTACGVDFTVWLTSVEGASILTAGLPQYGQLSHGTDNEYNTKDSSVRQAYEAQPRPKPIAAFAGETIVKVAFAVDKNGYVYTWGFGGYGSGWNLQCMDSGNMHHFVGAVSSCISWGHAQSGELGFGPHGQKTNVEDRLEQLDVCDGKASEEVGAEPVSESPVSQKASKKGSAMAPAKSNKRKSKDASQSEDEEENSDDDESDDYEEQSNGRAKSSGRGRGKAAGKATAAKKGTGHGRGRPPSANKSSQPEGNVSTGKRGRPRKL
ncbi:hypothetical protein K7X08_014832 [Anisodus acutangulus]|uniref:Uncharacterized protein n=1 Tax=Anisodus acutangulus TaxID=402998 RepID=A0A9Q1LMV2_9SOLA|nr:hypothetical protein K7X08_014832 [Anisodus acutangulus]